MIILPRDDVKKQENLAKIAKKFVKDKTYSEQEVNEIIKSFDAEDYVLFRRELINFNYLGRDSSTATYWLKNKALSKDKVDKIKANQDAIIKEQGL